METNGTGSGGTRVTAAAETDSFRAAFARVEAEAREISRDDLVHMNVDVPSVVSMLLGVLPRLTALREDIVKMPYFNIERFDKLRDWVHALGHTQVMHRAALSPAGALPELAEKVTGLRELLTSKAETLVTRKLFVPTGLGLCCGKRTRGTFGCSRGYRAVAMAASRSKRIVSCDRKLRSTRRTGRRPHSAEGVPATRHLPSGRRSSTGRCSPPASPI